MNDPDLLRAAIATAGLSARRFAADVLDVDERNMRRWLEGERELQGTVRVVCDAILARPALAEELARARASLKESLAKPERNAPSNASGAAGTGPTQSGSGFFIANVPRGVHPWLPAEEQFAEELEPSIGRHLALARQCVMAGSEFLGRAAGAAASPVFRAHSTLLVRTLQDLRCCVLCTMSGYPMQAWTVAASAFEAANMVGYIGRIEQRALSWLAHDSVKSPPATVYDTVRSTIEYLVVEPDAAKRDTIVKESYGLYQELCMAKHVNPIAERSRYLFLVNGVPNLILTPPFTPRRVAEARLGLVLAIRSAHIALWAFDVTHLAEPGLVDDPLGPMAIELGELIETVKDDRSTVESAE